MFSLLRRDSLSTTEGYLHPATPYTEGLWVDSLLAQPHLQIILLLFSF